MTEWERFVSGAVAAACAEVVTLPLDCIKTRLQNQKTVTIAESRPCGVALVNSPNSFNIHARLQAMAIAKANANANVKASRLAVFRNVLCDEKPTQLFRGINAALTRQVSYTSIRMVLYDPIRKLCEQTTKPGENPTFLHHFLAGGLAGAIGIAVANPFDVVKVRMQCDRSGTLSRSGILNSLVRIVHKEGFRAMAKGMLPNVQRAFVVNAAELGSYDQCKHILQSMDLSLGDHTRHFVSSGVAGFVSAAASNPLDVVKTRLMMHEARESRHMSMTNCLRLTLRHEGPSALFKGFWPNFARKGPWCLVFFFVYEQTQHRLRLLSDTREEWSV